MHRLTLTMTWKQTHNKNPSPNPNLAMPRGKANNNWGWGTNEQNAERRDNTVTRWGRKAVWFIVVLKLSLFGWTSILLRSSIAITKFPTIFPASQTGCLGEVERREPETTSLLSYLSWSLLYPKKTFRQETPETQTNPARLQKSIRDSKRHCKAKIMNVNRQSQPFFLSPVECKFGTEIEKFKLIRTEPKKKKLGILRAPT